MKYLICLLIFSIYPFQPSKGALVQITNHAANDYHPKWSPDGDKIAFTSERDGKLGIWVVQSDGGDPRLITNDLCDNYQVSWTPDSKKLALDLYDEQHATIVRTFAIGEPEEEYREKFRGGGFDLSVSPYQPVLDFSTPGEITPKLGLEVKKERILINPEKSNYSTWSPDGGKLAFCSEQTGNRDIWIMHSRGGIATQVTEHEANDFLPCWSPDGKKIAFVSDRTGNYDIWIVEVN